MNLNKVMKNIATKLIYYILAGVVSWFGVILIALYMLARRNDPVNTVSPLFALLIIVVILGAVVGITIFCVNFYKNGDVAKSRHDVANILGGLFQTWGLEYIGQLMMVVRGKTIRGLDIEIGFIPLPLRAGVSDIRILYKYQGTALLSLTLGVPADQSATTKEEIRSKLEKMSQTYPGSVKVSGNNVTFVSKNMGVIDNSVYRQFFRDLAKAID